MPSRGFEPCMCGDPECPSCGLAQGTLSDPECLCHELKKGGVFTGARCRLAFQGIDIGYAVSATVREEQGKTECPIHGDPRDYFYYLEAVEVLENLFGYTREEADSILALVGLLHPRES